MSKPKHLKIKISESWPGRFLSREILSDISIEKVRELIEKLLFKNSLEYLNIQKVENL